MRKLHLVFSFVAMIMLVACGGDSNSTKGADPIEEISAESLDDLPNCTKNREGVRAVTEEGSFVCADGVWEAEKKEIPSYETEDELPKCTLKKEGKVVYVVDMEDTLICESGEWKNVNDSDDEGDTDNDERTENDESSSSGEESDVNESSSSSQSQLECELTVAMEGDLPACSMKRDGITVCIEDIGEIVMCESGMWSIKISSSSSSENFESSSSEEPESSSSEKPESSSSESFESSSSEGEESSSSVESSAEVEISSDAGNGNSSAYDCSVYNCVTTEYLNQDMLESGLYGEYLDTRDNQVYKTVVIGTQTWMAQNLNYARTNSFCADNESSNCTRYGRLYKASVAATSCFEGWHVPSSSDWSTLYDFIYEEKKLSSNQVGKYLKSASLWTTPGVDSYGFSAVPGGYLWYNGTYKNVGTTVSFWVKSGTGMANVPKYLTSSDAFSEDSPRSNSDSFYIRCLKD